jgi:hypothetical protein
MNRRDFHHLAESGRIANDSPDDIHPISGDRISPQTHGGSPKKDRQDFPCSPESNVSDLHLSRRGFPVVADSGNRKVELFSPRADRGRDRKRRVDFVGRLRFSEFGLELNSTYNNTNSLHRFGHAIEIHLLLHCVLRDARTLACLLGEIKATIPRMLTPSYHRADIVNILLTDRLYEDMASRFGPSSLSTTVEAAYSQ